jgi:hypothetical protein
MLRYSYKTGAYIYSLKESKKKFKGGMVATFVGDRQVDICSDKSVPIGFFMHDTEINFLQNHATILVGQADLSTDVFEKNQYKINDFLYCSRNGKLTNEAKYKGNIIIGIVNYVNMPFIGLITCFARNIEN